VRNLVDGEEQVLVRRGANHIGREQEGQREDWRVSQACCAEYLEGHDAEDEVLCQGFDAA
jgi:hypothetical protein